MRSLTRRAAAALSFTLLCLATAPGALAGESGDTDAVIDVGFSAFSVTPTTIDVEHPDIRFSGRLVTRTGETDVGVAGVAVLVMSVGSTTSGNLPVSTVTAADGTFTGGARLGSSLTIHAVAPVGPVYGGAVSEPVSVTLKALPTRLSIAVSPDPAVVAEPGRMSGRLERQSRAGEWGPLAGKDVLVTRQDLVTLRVTVRVVVRTGLDGRYLATVLMPPGEGYWEVTYPWDHISLGGYGNSSAGTGSAVPAWYRTTITNLAIGPEPVGKGNAVTATGRVTRKSLSGQAPVAGGHVELDFSPDGTRWRNESSALTASTGSFTIRGPAERDGYWRVQYVPAGEPNLGSVSGRDWVDVRYRTAISSFNAGPEPVTKGRAITVRGTLYRHVDAWRPFGGQTVYFQFRAKGSSTWTYQGADSTDSRGRFARSFTARGDGTWRVRYSGGANHLPVVSWGDYVDVR